MKRRLSVALLSVCIFLAGANISSALSSKTIAKGLLDALKVGVENAIKQTGAEDGFLKNEAIKILLPEKLQPVAKILGKLGGDKLVGELVTKMNRAAEAAAPSAKEVFLPAIEALTFNDALAILKGKEDEATQFLRKTSGEVLIEKFLPVVTQQMESVGAVKAYQKLVGKAAKNPLAMGLGFDANEFDINAYVTKRAVDGLFHVISQEEKKIRKDPKARVTDLLGKVFGSLGGD